MLRAGSDPASLATALLVALPLGGVGCRAQPANVSETLTIAVKADVTGFYPNPPMRNESYTFTINRAIYDSLVKFDRALGLEPHLAVRWETPDEQTYLFDIHEAARFSDGRPVTARDVAASIDAALKHAWPTKDYLQPISSVRAIGERRVEIRTSGSNLTLLTRLPWAYVSPAASVDENPVPVVGSGPYKLESWAPGVEFVLARNAFFWGPLPDFERVRFVVVPDDSERVALVERGDAQLADHVPLEDLDRLDGRSDVRLRVGSGHRVLYLGMRLDAEPFDDPRVREAVDLAIDRRELIERALAGRAEPATQLVPPSIVGHNPDIAAPSPDRERARQLLAEAGYSNGFATVLDGPSNRYVNDAAIVREIARQLGEVGIRTEARTQDKSAFFSLAFGGGSAFHLLGWASETGDAGDAIEFLAHSPTGSRLGRLNTTAMKDPQIDASLAAVDRASNIATRSRHLQAALARVAEIRAIVPLVIQTQAVLHSDEIEWDPPLSMAIHPAQVRRKR